MHLVTVILCCFEIAILGVMTEIMCDLDSRSFHHRSFHHRSIQHGRFILRTVHHTVNSTPVDSSQSAKKQLAHIPVEDVLDTFEELATKPGHGEVAYLLRAHIRTW